MLISPHEIVTVNSKPLHHVECHRSGLGFIRLLKPGVDELVKEMKQNEIVGHPIQIYIEGHRILIMLHLDAYSKPPTLPESFAQGSNVSTFKKHRLDDNVALWILLFKDSMGVHEKLM